MKNFFKSITLAEWLIWSVSIVAVTVSFFVFGNVQYHYLAASLIGVTALMLVSKGNPRGSAFDCRFQCVLRRNRVFLCILRRNNYLYRYERAHGGLGARCVA